MTKYLLSRILRGMLSIVIVIAIVMLMVYSLLDRNKVLGDDYYKARNNDQIVKKYSTWENYGYVDFVPYDEYLKELLKVGDIDQETYNAAVAFGKKASDDSPIVTEYIEKFTKY